MKNVYTSIDLGSDSIKIVVCELHNDKLNLLATSSVKSKGIKKGLIVDAEKARDSVKEALNDIKSMLGIKIDKVIASVPANLAEFTFIKGETKVAGGIVSSEDIVKVMQSAMKNKLTPEKEMVTIIPIGFKLDEAEGTLQNPLGHKASKLAVRAIMVSTPKKNIMSVLAVLSSLKVEVEDIMINGVGVINALKKKEMENKVGAIVNIGAETINISLYNKGAIVKNSVINAGSIVIDLDIAKTYNVSLEKAKKIKERFAVAHAKYASKNEFYDVTTNESKKIRINQYELSEQVNKRYLKLIEVSIKEIASMSGKSLDYVVFTGGATNAYHFHSLLSEKLGDKASIGEVKIVGLRNNQNTAALGNIIYFINKLKLKGTEYSMINKEQTESLASVKNNTANISSDSMLNKVVSYFFGE